MAFHFLAWDLSTYAGGDETGDLLDSGFSDRNALDQIEEAAACCCHLESINLSAALPGHLGVKSTRMKRHIPRFASEVL
jgi:hypothetical protein